MRDVTVEEIADRVAAQFHLPKRIVRKLTRHMFTYIFKVMESKTDRVLMFKSDLPQVYSDYDVKKMCGEMIEGKRPSINTFFKGKQIKKIHRKYLSRPQYDLMKY